MKTVRLLAFVLFAASAWAQQTGGGQSGATGSGTVGNCSGAGNAFYSGAGTVVGCDQSVVDNGTGTLTFGTVGGNAGVLTINGTTSGSVSLSTPVAGGAVNINGGINLSGAAGAATTIATTTTNAGMTIAPNGTGSVTFNAGTAANPSMQFAGMATNTGFDSPSTTSVCLITTGTCHALLVGTGVKVGSGDAFGFASTAAATGSIDTGLTRSAAGIILVGNGSAADSSGVLKLAGVMSLGTKFTTNAGCGESAGTTTGGATAGKFTTSGSTSCTTTITMGNSATAPNGWSCTVHDITTAASANNPSSKSGSTTTAVITSGTIVASDVIEFSCTGY